MRAFRWHDVMKEANIIHFITTVTKDRSPVFADDRIASVVIDELRGYAERYNVLLVAAVVMPDHLHCIIWPQGKHNASEYMKGVKGYVAKRISDMKRGTWTPPIREGRSVTSISKIWQDGFFDYVITDEAKLDEKIWYIIRNPIEEGLIRENGSYPYLIIHQEYDPR